MGVVHGAWSSLCERRKCEITGTLELSFPSTIFLFDIIFIKISSHNIN